MCTRSGELLHTICLRLHDWHQGDFRQTDTMLLPVQVEPIFDPSVYGVVRDFARWTFSGRGWELGGPNRPAHYVMQAKSLAAHDDVRCWI